MHNTQDIQNGFPSVTKPEGSLLSCSSHSHRSQALYCGPVRTLHIHWRRTDLLQHHAPDLGWPPGNERKTSILLWDDSREWIPGGSQGRVNSFASVPLSVRFSNINHATILTKHNQWRSFCSFFYIHSWQLCHQDKQTQNMYHFLNAETCPHNINSCAPAWHTELLILTNKNMCLVGLKAVLS